MARASGAGVILINGAIALLCGAGIRRCGFLPDEDPERTTFARQLARKLAEIAIRRQTWRQGLLIGAIDGAPAREHFLAGFLEEAGFVNTTLGFQMRAVTQIVASASGQDDSAEGEEEPTCRRSRESRRDGISDPSAFLNTPAFPFALNPSGSMA